MADVKWSDDAAFVPQTSLATNDKIMGLTSGNVNAKYPGSLFNVSLNKSLFVEKNGNDTTGNGSISKPYLTCLKANSVAAFGDTIYVGTGTYSESNFQFKPGINWVGVDKDLVDIIMSSAVLDTTTWASASSPYLFFSNLRLDFVSFNFQPTSLNGGMYKIDNCNIQSTANLRLVDQLFITNSFISTLNVYWISSTESKNSRYGITLAIRAGNIAEVSEIDFFSDGDRFNNVSILNDVDGTFMFCRFTNAATRISGLTIDCQSQDSTSVFLDIVTAPVANNITIQNIGSTYPIIPSEEAKFLSTGHGFAYYPDSGNSFYYTGPSGSFANTLAMGRNIGDIAFPDVICLGFASCDKQSTFIAWDFSNPVTRGKAAQEYQFVAKYANGIGFQTDNPQANFHVKAGNTGTLLMSASAAVADGNISAGELNPYITTTSLILKGKYSGGSVFNYDLSALPGYVLTSGNQSINGIKTFTTPTTLFEVTNPLISNITPENLTATSGTITAGQLVEGNIFFGPSADATWTLPIASDIDSILGAISVSRGRSIKLLNQSNFNITINASATVLLTGLTTSGTLVLTPHASVDVNLVKTATGPSAYTLFGSSYGSLSYLEESYAHNTTWSGIWASAQTGNCLLNRHGNVVNMRIPQITATSNAAATIAMNTVLPSRFRPSTDAWIIYNMQTQNAAWSNGLLVVTTAGAITVYASESRGNFTSAVTSGLMSGSLTWVL